jgi:proteasome lid subunit RPN8/RPN11
VILLPVAVIEEMIAAASRALPREAVGFLAGNGDSVESLVPLEHIGDDRRFLVTPQSQFLAERKIRQRKQKVLALFHSHPDGGTALSPEDIAFAARQPWVQVVLAFPPDKPSAYRLGVWQVQARMALPIQWDFVGCH